MSRMNWPGNVRELRNVVTKLAISAPNEVISADDLHRHGGVDLCGGFFTVGEDSERATTVVEMERLMMVRALEATGGNQSRAAQQLGMPRRTFCRKLDEYQITLGRRRSGELAAISLLASHRVEYHAPVQVVTNSGLRFDAEATDVSVGGIGLRAAAERFVVGEEIRLRFSLPLHETPLCVTAAVAWRRADGTAGAQFTRIAAAHRHALLRWLSGTTQHHFHQTAHAGSHQIPA